ncbi:unnamed protein product [Vitrella brassicaformis CCMP3155]|uniref:Uncharacterized protein n=1 Tax=Vitrella brassicaformis (strain CCMP3155) TaxID=1169540 RepID=A0A0G4GPJ2_VITBC|nr:unnamed protein product [Vitrella brassicaformis CCMP3155]|eukprot:CEM32279.1 unnamed protein product [Vitrella brassicaformis CCMP3155]
MPPTSRLNGFHSISRLRGLRCAVAMTGGPVGLLDGHFVYELEVTGQRLAIKPSFHSHIKFCIEPDKSAVGTDKGQDSEEEDADQPPPSPPPSVALPAAATDKAADARTASAVRGSFGSPPLAPIIKWCDRVVDPNPHLTRGSSSTGSSGPTTSTAKTR